jgi:ABC-type branched-subunit amino acid transport system permease subunit
MHGTVSLTHSYFVTFGALVMGSFMSRKDGARPALFHIICYLCCSVVIVLFYVLFVCKCVLPPGDNPIAVNKYIIYMS